MSHRQKMLQRFTQLWPLDGNAILHHDTPGFCRESRALMGIRIGFQLVNMSDEACEYLNSSGYRSTSSDINWHFRDVPKSMSGAAITSPRSEPYSCHFWVVAVCCILRESKLHEIRVILRLRLVGIVAQIGRTHNTSWWCSNCHGCLRPIALLRIGYYSGWRVLLRNILKRLFFGIGQQHTFHGGGFTCASGGHFQRKPKHRKWFFLQMRNAKQCPCNVPLGNVQSASPAPHASRITLTFRCRDYLFSRLHDW